MIVARLSRRKVHHLRNVSIVSLPQAVKLRTNTHLLLL
jgi:hypothetical protein